MPLAIFPSVKVLQFLVVLVTLALAIVSYSCLELSGPPGLGTLREGVNVSNFC